MGQVPTPLINYIYMNEPNSKLSSRKLHSCVSFRVFQIQTRYFLNYHSIRVANTCCFKVKHVTRPRQVYSLYKELWIENQCTVAHSLQVEEL